MFVSHGVSLLATQTDWPSTQRLASVLPQVMPSRARAIVVVSAHWWGQPVQVSVDDGPLSVLDEGLPTRLLNGQGPYRGDRDTALEVLAALHRDTDGPGAVPVTGRGLDHGTLIPLRFLDPAGATPVVQVSLDARFDLRQHVAVGQALRTLSDDVLVVTSGGAVHNLNELVRFAPADLPPPDWAQRFDDNVERILRRGADDRITDLLALTHTAGYTQAHPTPDHFLPLLVAAGLGGTAEILHRSWQSSLSMATYALIS